MKTYEELYKLISKEIENTDYGKTPKELYESINYTMHMGGKRLRPVLVLMACNLFDEDIHIALNAAHAIEIFHNFTLVHDDIMDNAPLRRGQETVYKKWGMNTAVLSGDLMMIKATEILCKTDHSRIINILSVFNKAATQVCEGQQIDMLFENRHDVNYTEYIEMITLKTSVLLATSLQIGGIIGGAKNEDAEHLYEFGKNIGIAFQIQDDILDSFGDENSTGKKIGGDISSNKKTLLLIELCNSMHKDDKKICDELLIENGDGKINGILTLYKKYQIKEFAEFEKEKFLTLAFSHLTKVNVPNEKKQILISTAHELMNRIS